MKKHINMTLQLFESPPENIPATTGWLLADLGEARGKQELFRRQAPQKLKVLREHALIESSISSNRIEGIEIRQKRVGTVIFGKSPLQDRDEEEIRGYRNALRLIHEQHAELTVNEPLILELHSLSRGGFGDAGQFKKQDSNIIEKFPNGKVRVRFKTVPATETPTALRSLLHAWSRAMAERWVHPLIALAAFNLDFLCIHPFRDGNGRVSRLLLLLQCYLLGFEVGR
jgi:Fic family protein